MIMSRNPSTDAQTSFLMFSFSILFLTRMF